MRNQIIEQRQSDCRVKAKGGAVLPYQAGTEDLIRNPRTDAFQLLVTKLGKLSSKDDGHSTFKRVTVVMNTFDRFVLMKMLVGHYARMDVVEKIVLVWNNLKVAPPPRDFWGDAAVADKVSVATQNFDSLNNRFRPNQHIYTRCILIVDDDIMVEERDLVIAYHAWR